MSTVNPTFSNPFKPELHEKPDEVYRLNARIPRWAINRVKKCHLHDGTVETTITLLWNKLCYELDQRNIQGDLDDQRFEDFVARCVLVLPNERIPGGVPPPIANAEATNVSDGRGTSSLCSEAPGTKNDDADVKGGTRKRSGGRDKGKKTGKDNESVGKSV